MDPQGNWQPLLKWKPHHWHLTSIHFHCVLSKCVSCDSQSKYFLTILTMKPTKTQKTHIHLFIPSHQPLIRLHQVAWRPGLGAVSSQRHPFFGPVGPVVTRGQSSYLRFPNHQPISHHQSLCGNHTRNYQKSALVESENRRKSATLVPPFQSLIVFDSSKNPLKSLNMSSCWTSINYIITYNNYDHPQLWQYTQKKIWKKTYNTPSYIPIFHIFESCSAFKVRNSHGTPIDIIPSSAPKISLAISCTAASVAALKRSPWPFAWASKRNEDAEVVEALLFSTARDVLGGEEALN